MSPPDDALMIQRPAAGVKTFPSEEDEMRLPRTSGCGSGQEGVACGVPSEGDRRDQHDRFGPVGEPAPRLRHRHEGRDHERGGLSRCGGQAREALPVSEHRRRVGGRARGGGGRCGRARTSERWVRAPGGGPAGARQHGRRCALHPDDVPAGAVHSTAVRCGARVSALRAGPRRPGDGSRVLALPARRARARRAGDRTGGAGGRAVVARRRAHCARTVDPRHRRSARRSQSVHGRGSKRLRPLSPGSGKREGHGAHGVAAPVDPASLRPRTFARRRGGHRAPDLRRSVGRSLAAR